MLLVAALLYAAPDHVAARLPAGTGATDLLVDGTRAAFSVEGHLGVLDLETWDVQTVASCTGAAGVAGASGSFYLGCEDGTVLAVDSALTATEVASLDGPVLGLWTDGAGLFVLVDLGDTLQLAGISLDSGDVVTGFPVTLGFDGFEDLVAFGTSLLVLHGSDTVSRVESTSGALIGGTELFLADFVQGAADGETGVLLADAAYGSVVRFDGYDNGYTSILTAVGDSATAVATDGATLVVVVDGALHSFPYTTGGFAGSESAVLDGLGEVNDLAFADGYLLGTDGADVLVLTDRPWVEISDLSATDVVAGDTVEVTFSSDQSGSWVATVDGAELAAGEVEAGVPVTAGFTVDDRFPEGTSRVFVTVGTGEQAGHDAVDLEVNNPPGAVVLGAGAIGVGDGQLSVSFTGLSDSDIDTYTVYLATQPFTAAEYLIGGPAWAGDPAVDAPRLVTAGSPGAATRVSFFPLENGATYYVAVRATDQSGLEGPMSDVQSGTPVATYSASQLSGEPGGLGCSVAAQSPGGLLAAAAAAFLVLARRRAGALAVVLLVSPGLARAEAGDPKPHMNVHIHGGPISLADPHVRDIFGKMNKSFTFEYGATTRLFEVDLGVGFFQELGFLPTENGTLSNEHDMLTLVPLMLTGTLRLDVLDEQILVPFARIGGNYTMWRENWYVYDGSPEDSERKGAKIGWHWGVGGMILLDPLDAKAASRMEATAGIDDTFLVVEYRRTQMPTGANVLQLSSEQVDFGVKFDF